MRHLFAAQIHRHTGGLESGYEKGKQLGDLPRHIGGLESNKPNQQKAKSIHRHTGGWVLISKTVKFIYFY